MKQKSSTTSQNSTAPISSWIVWTSASNLVAHRKDTASSTWDKGGDKEPESRLAAPSTLSKTWPHSRTQKAKHMHRTCSLQVPACVQKCSCIQYISSFIYESFMFICLILVAGGWNHPNFHQLALSLWGEVAAWHPFLKSPPDLQTLFQQWANACRDAGRRLPHRNGAISGPWQRSKAWWIFIDFIVPETTWNNHARQCKVSTNPWNTIFSLQKVGLPICGFWGSKLCNARMTLRQQAVRLIKHNQT